MNALRHRLRASTCGVVLVGVSVLASRGANAEQAQVTAPLLNPFTSLTTSARLRFDVTLGSFLSLKVGSMGSAVNTATFDLTPLTAGCTAAPCKFGDSTPVAATYDGGFGATGLPVEVRSNAGVVKLTASATTALTSGGNTVPMSQVIIASSDSANLPAPTLPDSGVSTAVAVAETSAGSRITSRTANWTFTYANIVVPAAGTYNGEVTFTASAP